MYYSIVVVVDIVIIKALLHFAVVDISATQREKWI